MRRRRSGATEHGRGAHATAGATRRGFLAALAAAVCCGRLGRERVRRLDDASIRRMAAWAG
jgi:hypothetical protein